MVPMQPSEDFENVAEAELLDRLRMAQALYDRATPDKRGEAKLQYLAALGWLSDFIMGGWVGHDDENNPPDVRRYDKFARYLGSFPTARFRRAAAGPERTD